MKDIIVRVADWYEELSAIQAIRKSVFQEEQGVEPDLDFDGEDETSQQLIACLNGEYVGTARIRYLDGNIAKIERLAVLPVARRYGVGRKLMEKAMEVIADKNIPEVVIHAQEYVKGLYQQLGFQQEGEVFEEGGIRHVKMRKKFNP
ncbi:GNAT family N-acetyltransferase [Brasilonema sp. UFV-L1]|uniref:GNAT family N-acetyltransferase n=1 Tax=Brasilonema sp. UFV-L1 TaxID=2234130 RepID=UPI00145F1127|nr:GNAT family N-acetyltransferase [Brasilonema sp. UFV-L1]NMG08519.1 GNAT family N-acetyltransferase [Brasilonema sp. UFV-L1]